jgi:hypothetical protein
MARWLLASSRCADTTIPHQSQDSGSSGGYVGADSADVAVSHLLTDTGVDCSTATLNIGSGIVSRREPRREASQMARQMLELTIRRKGWKFAEVTAKADPKDADELRRVLVDAIQREGFDENRIDEFEMDVRYAGTRGKLLTYAATS